MQICNSQTGNNESLYIYFNTLQVFEQKGDECSETGKQRPRDVFQTAQDMKILLCPSSYLIQLVTIAVSLQIEILYTQGCL